MLGHSRQMYRVNDDGEPSGSAGKPILGQINSFHVTNVLIVVVRYFGGKLLGVSGLINAYRSAAESALKNSEITELYIQDFYEVIFPYGAINDVMKIIKDDEAGQSQQKFELECRMIINFRTSARERILNALSRIDGVKYRHTDTF
jgi:putative IMPACT (imprinted ancient) family translation regulator